MKKINLQSRLSLDRHELRALATEILSLHHNLLIPPPFVGGNPAVERRNPNGHIPRPSNAWILFRAHLITTVMKPLFSDKPELRMQAVASILGSLVWREMREEQRRLWHQKAHEEKELHQRLYPDYKFMRKSKQKGFHRKTRAKRTITLDDAISLDPLPLKWETPKTPDSFDHKPTAAHPDFYNLFPTQYDLFNYEASFDSVLNFGFPPPPMAAWCGAPPFHDLFPLSLPHVQVPSPETPREKPRDSFDGPNLVFPGLVHL